MYLKDSGTDNRVFCRPDSFARLFDCGWRIVDFGFYPSEIRIFQSTINKLK